MTTSPADPGRDPAPLLQVRDLVQTYVGRGYGGASTGAVQAVSGVSFDIGRGESFGVVGETGSGKSTLARSVLHSPGPKSGQVIFGGDDLASLGRAGLRQARQQMQMVFQDPVGSLDPKWRIEQIVEEPLLASGFGDRAARARRVAEVLELVDLDPAAYAARRPRELSGGQCQRVAIARALTMSPALLICDEAVSSLDVLIQAQVITLLARLRRELGLSYMFIAHDLALVRQVSDRVAVMYLGKFCEVGDSSVIFSRPAHPYTAALLASAPTPDPTVARTRVSAEMSRETPSPVHPPSGCRFRTRCPRAAARCAEQEPPMLTIATGHQVACHFPLTADADGPVGEASRVGLTADVPRPATVEPDPVR